MKINLGEEVGNLRNEEKEWKSNCERIKKEIVLVQKHGRIFHVESIWYLRSGNQSVQLHDFLSFFSYLFFFFAFLGPHLQDMEIPSLGVESEL